MNRGLRSSTPVVLRLRAVPLPLSCPSDLASRRTNPNRVCSPESCAQNQLRFVVPPTNFSFRAKMSTDANMAFLASCFFAQNHSIEGGATYFRVVARGGMLCKSVGRIVVWRECPAAQKVSYLRPPSQLSIPRPTERPTERPTDLLLLKTSARFRPRWASLGRSS